MLTINRNTMKLLMQMSRQICSVLNASLANLRLSWAKWMMFPIKGWSPRYHYLHLPSSDNPSSHIITNPSFVMLACVRMCPCAGLPKSFILEILRESHWWQRSVERPMVVWVSCDTGVSLTGVIGSRELRQPGQPTATSSQSREKMISRRDRALEIEVY